MQSHSVDKNTRSHQLPLSSSLTTSSSSSGALKRHVGLWLLSVVAIDVVSLSAHDARADNTDTDSVGVSGGVISPIEITSVSPIQTGNVIKPSGGEFQTSVSIPANGDPPIYSGGGDPGSTPGTSSPGSVNLSGEPLFAYTVACPFFASGSSGTLQFQPVCPLGGTMTGSGTDSFNIGGTLNVSAAAPTGAFSFDFDVTVTYN